VFQLGLEWLRGADALAAAVRRVVVYALTPRGTPRCWFVTAWRLAWRARSRWARLMQRRGCSP